VLFIIYFGHGLLAVVVYLVLLHDGFEVPVIQIARANLVMMLVLYTLKYIYWRHFLHIDTSQS